jgi:hypothetical protein
MGECDGCRFFNVDKYNLFDYNTYLNFICSFLLAAHLRLLCCEELVGRHLHQRFTLELSHARTLEKYLWPNGYFNPNAFMLPAPGTYGNVRRDALIGPGLTELDLSALKTTAVSEKIKLQFRAELFNVLNHTNFGTPNPIVFSSASSVSGGRRDYIYLDDLAPGPVWLETVVLSV